ncbi:MAG: hypothetical protein AB8B78_14670, partial [Polaribacter sp.]
MKKITLLVLLTLFFTNTVFSQFSLGDIAFTGYQSDGSGNPSGENDEFSFILLRNVTNGDKISFTDNGWMSSGGFRSGETEITLEFTSNYVFGTQVSIASTPFKAFVNGDQDVIAGTLTGSSLSLVTSGDQIFAYNPANKPSSQANQSGFIAAIQMNGDWDADSTSSTTSSQPSIFTTLANSSVAISPEVDNAIYNCSTASGNATALRAAINNSSNWTTSSETPFDLPPICATPTTVPTITTTVANSILANSVTLAGNVTADGGANVTERGIVFAVTSANNNPEIGGTGVTKNTNGNGTGLFSENISGLTANTSYSFKAYAINSEGTNYGNVLTFTTPKANQTITFGALASKTFGDSSFALTASASSGLTTTYTSSNTDVATVSGNTVTIVGAGSTNITASQVGNTNYNAASNVIQALTVGKANQTITFGALASKTFGDSSFALTASASSGLTTTYTSSNTDVATVSGNT